MIVSVIGSILASALLFLIWPVLFTALVRLGQGIAGLGAAGAGIYAFLNRLLLPMGLHHALNNVFWFDTVGLGDLTHYWAGDTSADVGWSLGMYMSGFFPCMMFGVPGAVLAMVRSARPSRRRAVIGVLGSAALCSFVCGITEPFEFAFMFAAPGLYLVYSLLYGLFTYATVLAGFRAGFSFSAGAADLLFSASLPAAAKTWMILPLGLAAFAVFYMTFRVLIGKYHLPVPGQEAEPETGREETGQAGRRRSRPAKGIDGDLILQGLGGAENVLALDNCATRLRVEVRDPGLVDEALLKAGGARGVMKTGKDSIQVIIGLRVQEAADAVRSLLS